MPDSSRSAQLVEALQASVKRIAEDVNTSGWGPPKRRRIKAEVDILQTTLDELADKPPPDTKATRFADFFEQMGRGLVDTQTKLDTLSEGYIQQVRPRSIPPSMFRMPKLEAEIKFGMSSEGTKGINLLFFQKREVARQYQEHTLKFEMLSVPPPLEVLNEIDRKTPRIDLIIDLEQRDAVFAAVDACLTGKGGTFVGSSLDRSHAAAAFKRKPQRRRVLIIDSPTPDEHQRATRGLILHYTHKGTAGDEPIAHIGLWKLALATRDDDTHQLAKVWRVSSAKPTEFAPWEALLKPVWDKQDRWLMELTKALKA